MKVGNHVHDAYEDGQANGHGEADDGEAYEEHDSHDKRNGALSTDVVVQFPLSVGHQFPPEGPVLFGEYLHPVLREILVVQQNEEHVEQGNQGGHYTEYDAGRLAQ